VSAASEYLRRVVEHEKKMARRPFPRRYDAGYIAGLERAIKELSYFDHCDPAGGDEPR
jgi:hypothetical protein